MENALLTQDRSGLQELSDLEEILGRLGPLARVEVLANPSSNQHSYPIYGVSLGSSEPNAPTLGLFGGVHGLERIGSQVVIAYLETLRSLLEWDRSLQDQLKRVRIVFIPIINPIGMRFRMRSNGNGVDLMRNAPVEAQGPTLLVGGHRLSPRLPWFRGKPDGRLEVESLAVCQFVKKEMGASKVSIALDIHSGFGFKDRLWFPYAKTKEPFPHLAEAFALKETMDRTLPNHVYIYEPQSGNYVTHGDLWDYLYDQQILERPEQLFLPLTLEMGSWQWLRKNPVQSFSFLGFFNPVKPHRKRRILRRHLPLLDFLLRAVDSHEPWAGHNPDAREALAQKAKDLWYRRSG